MKGQFSREELIKIVSEIARVPVWLFLESYRQCANLPEALSLVLPSSKEEISEHKLLHEFFTKLTNLSGLEVEAELKENWPKFSQQLRYELAQMLLGLTVEKSFAFSGQICLRLLYLRKVWGGGYEATFGVMEENKSLPIAQIKVGQHSRLLEAIISEDASLPVVKEVAYKLAFFSVKESPRSRSGFKLVNVDLLEEVALTEVKNLAEIKEILFNASN